MSPWLIEPLAAARLDDLRRPAPHRRSLPHKREAFSPFTHGVRRRLGEVLIHAGTRLGGAETAALPACTCLADA